MYLYITNKMSETAYIYSFNIKLSSEEKSVCLFYPQVVECSFDEENIRKYFHEFANRESG